MKLKQARAFHPILFKYKILVLANISVYFYFNFYIKIIAF